MTIRRFRVDRVDIGRWVIAPALIGAVLGLGVPPPMTWGIERVHAVLLLDGQAYFGHVREAPWSDTIELRDVYYFQDARNTTQGVPLGLVKRGAELHQPRDVMEIRRDKILAIEPVGPSSPVMGAIAAERTLPGLTR